MKAYVVKRWVHPSELTLSTDVPEPKPLANEVIVEVYSAALNFFDVRQPALTLVITTSYLWMHIMVADTSGAREVSD